MSPVGRHAGGNGKWLLRLVSAAALVALLGGCSIAHNLAQLIGIESSTDPEVARLDTDQAVAPEASAAAAHEMLAQAPVSDDTLSEKRGGFSFGGMDFKFGLSLFASTSNGLSLSTMLNMNDNGHWVPTLTQTQVVQQTPVVSTVLTLNSSATNQTPANIAITQNGPVTFTQSVGNPSTTQIVNQIAGNNIQTLITNTVNNVNVNSQGTLNVTVTGAPTGHNGMATFAAINKFADQMSRLSH